MIEKQIPDTREIIARYQDRIDDYFGHERMEYLYALPTAEDIETAAGKGNMEISEDYQPAFKSREDVLKRMEEYMEFAWDKANNFRGLSAGRSIQHYIAWTWLAGDPELTKEIENMKYQYYGKDILKRICEYYGWDASQWDDGVRSNGYE